MDFEKKSKNFTNVIEKACIYTTLKNIKHAKMAMQRKTIIVLLFEVYTINFSKLKF
jgi:hypothetical protein